MLSRWRPHTGMVAFVDYQEPVALAALAKVSRRSGGEAMVDGWSQSEAVQAATRLAWLRTELAGDLQIIDRSQELQIPVVGREYLPPDDYRRILCLATDEVIYRIAEARQGDASFATAIPAVAPLLVAVMGAAVAVVATAAVWRWLDPDLRAAVHAVDQSLEAARDRYEVMRDTGRLPPPTPLEQESASVVLDLAKARASSRGINALAIGGGVLGTIVALAMVRQL